VRGIWAAYHPHLRARREFCRASIFNRIEYLDATPSPIYRSRYATQSNVSAASLLGTAPCFLVIFLRLICRYFSWRTMRNAGLRQRPWNAVTIGEVQLRALVVKPRAARSGTTLTLNSLPTGRITIDLQP
jgi:hypothetical protein